MHGYELRKRVTGLLGWGRVLSYGSLYPCLKQMLRDGLITEDTTDEKPVTGTATRGGRRGKIVYKLTADGKERFATLVSASGPSAWEDDNFGVHFAFFGSAAAARSGSTVCVRRWPALASGSTPTPWSCNGTASTRSSGRSAG
jgi:DNA-binding PadR family transcriptional regulator